jgi:hypothetical protein
MDACSNHGISHFTTRLQRSHFHLVQLLRKS